MVRTELVTSPGKGRKREEVRSDFVFTPERASQYLEKDIKTVIAELETVKGRDRLFKEFMQHEAQVRQDHPDFEPDVLRKQIDAQAEMRLAKKNLLEDANASEKKGLWKRSWDAIKKFPRKHPFITTALVLAAVAGGMYLSWKYLPYLIPVPNTAQPAVAVAETVLPPTGGAFSAIPAGEIVPAAPFVPSYAPTVPTIPGNIPGGIVIPPAPPTVPFKPDLGTIFSSEFTY